MTKLIKPIRRELQVPSVSRSVVIEIDPETKRLGFREHGCRKTYWLPIATAYAMAVRTEKKEPKP